MRKSVSKNVKNKKPLGLVPEFRFSGFGGEWEKIAFANICKFVRGPFGGSLTKEIFVEDGYAVYEQSHAIYNKLDVFRYFITKEKFNELKRFAVFPNDIIMSCSGTMGKFAIIPESHKRGVINQALLKLTVKKGYDIKFIRAVLELPSSQDNLLSQSAGGAIKNVVSVNQLKEMKFRIPNFKEQQKIATCLSSLDDLITAQTQKLESLKNHKKGLMQKLFPAKGKTVPEVRFPGFREKWGEYRLKEIANVVAGQSPDGDCYNEKNEGVPFYQGKTDFGNIYLNNPTKWTTQITKIANQGDILMSVRAPVGALNISTNKVCIGRGLAAIQTNQNKWFLYYFLYNNQKSIHGNGGSIFDSINKEQIENLVIKVPKLKEQQKIATFLSSLDDLITTQTQKLALLKTHKKGLMQGLFPSVEEVGV